MRSSRAYKMRALKPPMPVDDWPVMKQEIIDGRYGKLLKLYDEDE